MITTRAFQLEDELGDVLDKAMRLAGLGEEALAASTGVGPERLRDAIDYRGDLTCDELRRIALALGLNEVGFCALGIGRYPSPEIGALPFRVWPLRMAHGIGVTNAYLVAECGSQRAILFDTGAGPEALAEVWPQEIRGVAGVFLTHLEREHAGGLCGVVSRFQVDAAFAPQGATAPCGVGIGDGEQWEFGGLRVTALATPGHVAAHNCYLVEKPGAKPEGTLLVAGDLVFAGSVGGAYFSAEALRTSLRRVFSSVPARTVIAPGHGPLTTVAHEARYNPFSPDGG